MVSSRVRRRRWTPNALGGETRRNAPASQTPAEPLDRAQRSGPIPAVLDGRHSRSGAAASGTSAVLDAPGAASLRSPCGVVLPRLTIQGCGTLVLPAVLGCLTPEFGHVVMELTADLLRFAPTLGGFPLLTSGDF